jgi:hypothetical protein
VLAGCWRRRRERQRERRGGIDILVEAVKIVGSLGTGGAGKGGGDAGRGAGTVQLTGTWKSVKWSVLVAQTRSGNANAQTLQRIFNNSDR